MADDLHVEKQEAAPDARPPGEGARETASLRELAERFHLFTLGPVYVGAGLDTDLMAVFAEQEDIKFDAVTIEQPFPMFKNLNEWDYMLQGIARTDDLGNVKVDAQKDRVTEKFSQFLQGYEFVRKETGFYARVYSRPIVVIPPGERRGVSVEVFMLMSNKGTHRLRGANPYVVEVSPEVNEEVRRNADVVLGIVGGQP